MTSRTQNRTPASAGVSQRDRRELALHVDGLYTRTVKFSGAHEHQHAGSGDRAAAAAGVGQHRPAAAARTAPTTTARCWCAWRSASRPVTSSRVSTRSRSRTTPGPARAATATAQITDILNPGLDQGPADVDRRHALVASGAFLLPDDVTLGAVWALRSSMPFSALAGRDLNGDGSNTDYVPGTTRNQGNRDLDLALVNAWRASNGRAADLRRSARQQPLQPYRRAREQGDRARRHAAGWS